MLYTAPLRTVLTCFRTMAWSLSQGSSATSAVARRSSEAGGAVPAVHAASIPDSTLTEARGEMAARRQTARSRRRTHEESTVSVYIYTYTRTHARTHTHTHTRTYIHTYIYTHVYIYIYIKVWLGASIAVLFSEPKP